MQVAEPSDYSTVVLLVYPDLLGEGFDRYKKGDLQLLLVDAFHFEDKRVGKTVKNLDFIDKLRKAVSHTADQENITVKKQNWEID